MWKNDPRSLGSKVPSFDVSQNYSRANSILRNRNSRFSNFSNLPVITEEENGVEDENEVPKYFYSNNVQKNYQSKNVDSVPYNTGKEKKENVKRFYKGLKPSITFSPSININCLMNADVKQTKALWKTSFGKRLIYGKEGCENVDVCEIRQYWPKRKVDSKSSLDSRSISENDSDKVKISERILSHPKKNNVLKAKNGAGDFASFQLKKLQTQKKYKKKSKKILKKFQENLKNNKDAGCNLEVKQEETPTKEKTEPSAENISQNITEIPRVPSIIENKHVLTNCVKNILDGITKKTPCEYCDESFEDEELIRHKKRHELEKQECLLCQKTFYKADDFVQHLLNHKRVDRFICKKCKKYFRTMKMYKDHYQNFHSVPSQDASDKAIAGTNESETKSLPKHKCRRCSERFETEEALAEHKKTHRKTDQTRIPPNPKKNTEHIIRYNKTDIDQR